MGKKKVIIDTNVIISAFAWGGVPKRLMDLVVAREIELIMSKPQCEEILRVLDYPKLALATALKNRIRALMQRCAKLVDIDVDDKPIDDDLSDNDIIAPAASMRIHAIISGDRHILDLGSFHGASIVTAKEFLEEHMHD